MAVLQLDIALLFLSECFHRSCAYTLLKSIKGRGKEVKCQNLGPSSHARSVKWDFAENLIPTSAPSLEEETFRILPGMRGKVHGLCVYVPTPEVEFFSASRFLP